MVHCLCAMVAACGLSMTPFPDKDCAKLKLIESPATENLLTS